MQGSELFEALHEDNLRHYIQVARGTGINHGDKCHCGKDATWAVDKFQTTLLCDDHVASCKYCRVHIPLDQKRFGCRQCKSALCDYHRDDFGVCRACAVDYDPQNFSDEAENFGHAMEEDAKEEEEAKADFARRAAIIDKFVAQHLTDNRPNAGEEDGDDCPQLVESTD
jgi:hypothetical protein